MFDPADFPYRRAALALDIAGRTWRLDALSGFEENVAAVYRTLGGRRPDRDPGDWMPMFGVLWPGAVAMARRVAGLDLAGVHVLELGCGLALPSLVAAAGGARVTATDNHPHAGAFLSENARRNGVHVDYCALDWRDPAPTLPRDRWPFVIACDLLYSPELAPLVAQAIAARLETGGVAWLMDPGRLALSAFEGALPSLGLDAVVEVVDEGDRELFFVTLTHARPA